MSLLNFLGIGLAGVISSENKEELKKAVSDAIDHAANEERPYEIRAVSRSPGQGVLTFRIKRPVKKKDV